ncbi:MULTISPECIES: acetyl-CoA carboxylase biotin carboxylase subunit [Peribacillus]|uniref:acetyl-CoA carboxylase biotin carboxylase subunit n=1 Tax=Peribacillus TaxID=2675229 RepID=UPI001913E406|nr:MULTISPECIES: acetyl-CoA carboxylase biotin carboxylase subunit [unclassified Peribacillus]MBK5460168.1 acetyl-CoA carboxylase biotin carboxylase subunit [Peribacillus sp. TH27]MBK5498357.1 acetyl-CoA carboxylase biotin carboxylase subunit [Peribacillus sp. TH14]WMX56528.1 acetyl-CoA carboxylase biotin carboxylase subunit [Peribacillus sp. R9-11]
MGYFKKVLIANRGEIARRIIRTCNKEGIQTVAVYSEADAEAPYVSEATEAVCIGPAQAKKSYLDIEKVIQVAKETHADAIHPGYGFLSENPEFVRRCEEENIVFIGPSAETIHIMGSKLEARTQMQKAGVRVVPGTDKSIESVDEALLIANDLGYPLMLKASAGGGGIGMQLVQNDAELIKVFDATKQQATSFFKDGTVFLEKWISKPRHIEVQIVADTYGNVLHLFERECSVQRRNQKVIEESPSPFLNDTLRKELLDAAIRGVKQIDYTNVGTMEFIFDENQNFYFLEMNTRLQVEHPVTEEITGLDLVELQLKIAAKEKLTITQEEINKTGHAIECRLYAEDPNTFFPSPGVISRLKLPENDVRFDFGIIEGSAVTPFYDPMIGKIIVHGITRDQAIEKMQRVLDEIDVQGVKTNLMLLKQIMKNNQFIRGNYTTQFLAENKIQVLEG